MKKILGYIWRALKVYLGGCKDGAIEALVWFIPLTVIAVGIGAYGYYLEDKDKAS